MSEMAETQIQIEFKKRARRRLIGAVVLAIVLIITLPMVMDKAPPSAPSRPVVVQVPGQTPFETPPPAQVAVAPQPETVAPPEPEPEVVVAPPDSAEALPQPPESGAVRATVVPHDVASAQSEEKPKPKEETKPAVKPPPAEAKTKPADKPTDKTADKKSSSTDGERAAAILSGKTPATVVASAADTANAQASGSGKFYIPIATYANVKNAEQAVAKATALGIPVYREYLSDKDGTKTRVRAGPFPSQKAAEQARTKLSQAGFNPGGISQR